MEFDGSLNLPKKLARAVRACARDRERDDGGRRGKEDGRKGLSYSSIASDEDSREYRRPTRHREHKHEERPRPRRQRGDRSDRGERRRSQDYADDSDEYHVPSYATKSKADSIYMAEMARYRDLWQKSQIQQKDMERKHSEEILMKESAFSRTIESLQAKFEECKSGLLRLTEERDEASNQVSELQASLNTMSASFNREAAANARNSNLCMELEGSLKELKEQHNGAKDNIATIMEQLQEATERIIQNDTQIASQENTISNQTKTIGDMEGREKKRAEKDKRRKKEQGKDADIMAQQEEEIDRLRALAATQDSKISTQKKQIAALTQRLGELDGAGEKHHIKIEAQKKDIAYLTGYQSKQDEIMGLQKEQIAKLCKRVNELKNGGIAAAQMQEQVMGKDEQIGEMQEQLRAKDDQLKRTLSSKKVIEKKLDLLVDKLKSKEYLTYVPLCQSCKALRGKMQKWKKAAEKNQKTLKKRVEKLQEALVKASLDRKEAASATHAHHAHAAPAPQPRANLHHRDHHRDHRAPNAWASSIESADTTREEVPAKARGHAGLHAARHGRHHEQVEVVGEETVSDAGSEMEEWDIEIEHL